MAPVITEEQDEEIAIDDETAHEISVGMYLQISTSLPAKKKSLPVDPYISLHFVFPS
jgi:hypothetical protein